MHTRYLWLLFGLSCSIHNQCVSYRQPPQWEQWSKKLLSQDSLLLTSQWQIPMYQIQRYWQNPPVIKDSLGMVFLTPYTPKARFYYYGKELLQSLVIYIPLQNYKEAVHLYRSFLMHLWQFYNQRPQGQWGEHIWHLPSKTITLRFRNYPPTIFLILSKE